MALDPLQSWYKKLWLAFLNNISEWRTIHFSPKGGHGVFKNSAKRKNGEVEGTHEYSPKLQTTNTLGNENASILQKEVRILWGIFENITLSILESILVIVSNVSTMNYYININTTDKDVCHWYVEVKQTKK